MGPKSREETGGDTKASQSSGAVGVFRRLISPHQQKQQQKQKQEQGQEQGQQQQQQQGQEQQRDRVDLLDGTGKQRGPRRVWGWLATRQRSKVSLSDEQMSVGAAATPSSPRSYCSQERTSPVESIDGYDLSQMGTESLQSPPQKSQVEGSTITRNSTPEPLPEDDPLQQLPLQPGQSDDFGDVVGGESGHITAPQSIDSTPVVVDSTGDNQQQTKLDAEPPLVQDLDSASQSPVSEPVGDHQDQPNTESTVQVVGFSAKPIAKSTTSEHPYKSDKQSSLPASVISPSKKDSTYDYSLELAKPESPVNLEQRFEEHKLETEFHDDYVVHKTYEWESLGSRRLWEESRWKKKGVIGSGSFGAVFLQERVGGGKKEKLRAVKVIPRAAPKGKKPSQELLALVKLRGYEHLFVRFLGWYEDQTNIFLAMEYVEYGDLDQYIKSSREGNPEVIIEAKEITRQILEGLEVLHSKDIYHRDLKPQNILMASLSPIWVKIADFGVSKLAINTVLQTVAGTQGYIAPELLGVLPRGAAGFTAYALDIWSLGSLVHTILAYESPFTEVYQDFDPETGVMTGESSESGTDMYSLGDYCRGGRDFPTEPLQKSPLPVGEEEIAFVKSLLIADPKSRPTARAALQHPWLRGYTNHWVEKLKNEFSSLGVDLNLGRTTGIRKTLVRQIGKNDISQYLPSSAKGNLLPLLLKAIEKRCNLAISRLLKSLGIGSLDNETRGGLFEIAINTGHLDTIEILLQNKVDVGASVRGETVLQRVVKTGKSNLVNVFLRDMSDVQTVLLIAVKLGNVDMVQWLLGKGFDINTPNYENQTVLHAAYADGHTEIFELLLREGVAVNPLRTMYLSVLGGRTILQTVAGAGNTRLVKLLLDYKADVNSKPARLDGRTALQAAAEGGHLDIVKLLLNGGAHINARAAHDSGRTALQAAAQHGHIGIVRLLLDERVDVNAEAAGNGGQTALQAAVDSGRIDIVALLLESGANVNDGIWKDGRTALQIATQSGRIDIVTLLLESGANVNVGPRKYGPTPLQAAAIKGSTALVKLLLDNKAIVNAPPALEGGRTALQAGAESGNIDIVQLLLNNGANLNDKAAEGKGLTALQAAVRGGNPEIVNLLLAKGANVNARPGSRWGRTALQAAAESGKIDMVRLLLENKAQINARGAAEGRAALHAAAENGHINTVKLLLDSGVGTSTGEALQAAATGGFADIVKTMLEYNPESTQSDIRATLVAAAGTGHISIVQLLLRQRAHVSVGNALEAAAGHGHIDIVQLLLEEGTPVFPENAQTCLGVLEIAIEGAYTDIFKLLWNNKAYVIAASAASTDKAKPLLKAAAAGGHIEILKLLLGSRAQDQAVEDNAIALEAAAGGGHIVIVHLLLQNPDTRPTLGRALEAAAGRGHAAIVEFLLDSDDDFSTKITPDIALRAAAYGGHIGVLKLLLDRGAEVTKAESYDRLSNVLDGMIEGGHTDAVKLLLPYTADISSKPRIYYGKFLYLAVRGGYTEIVKHLLDKGVDTESPEFYKTLEFAAGGGDTDTVKLLLDSVANPKDIKEAYRYIIPLRVAVEGGYIDIVKLLLDIGADANTRFGGHYAQSVLFTAVISGNTEIVKLLLDARAEPDIVSEIDLSFAACLPNIEIVKLLLDNGASASAQGDSGEAIKNAAESANIEIVKLLLDNGADVNVGTNKHSALTALQAAAKSGNTEVFKYLLDNGADVNVKPLESYNTTALQAGIGGGNIEIVKLLLDLGADVNLKSYNSSPLIDAILSGDTNMVRLLLDLGADVNTYGYEESPLVNAIAGGDIDMVMLLLENGAETNSTRSHQTPLQAAAKIGNLSIVKLLLDNKADVHARGKSYSGDTALHAAIQGGNFGIIKLLMGH